MQTFPSRDEWARLVASLQGKLISPQSDLATYANISVPHNLRVMRQPGAIVMVETTEDVQEVVRFAKKYDLFVTVWSSGHSYIGRSTHEGALVINLERMKGKTFNLNSERSPAGEVAVESGNSWLEVDEQVTGRGTRTTT
ncbi:hypothetical protein BaRGS_00035446, partial [Batillaria attramentaria]